MEVKVKTLKKYILFIVVFSVISIIAYNVYDKKRTEKMREIEMKEDIEEAIDREYKDLLEEYAQNVKKKENLQKKKRK